MSADANQAAYISPGAAVARTAIVHAGAWIGPGVELEADVVVGPGAVVGYSAGEASGPVRVGAGTKLGPNVCVEPATEIGPKCTVGAASILRAGTHLEQGVSAGILCTLMGHCRVGEYACLYSEVHICEFATLGPHCQLMPGSMLLNQPYPPTGLSVAGPVIGQCAIIGSRSLIWPGVKLGHHAMVATISEVKQDVPDYTLVRGRPAKPICDVRRIRTKAGDEWVYPYPWMRHNIPGEDITRPAS